MITVKPSQYEQRKLALHFGTTRVLHISHDEARLLWEALNVYVAPKSARRLQVALKALRIIAGMPGNSAMAKVARIALSDCRNIRFGGK